MALRVECRFFTELANLGKGRLRRMPVVGPVWGGLAAAIALVAYLGVSCATTMFLVGPAFWTRSLVAGTALEQLLPASLAVLAMLGVAAFGKHLLGWAKGRTALDMESVFMAIGAAFSALMLLHIAATGWPTP